MKKERREGTYEIDDLCPFGLDDGDGFQMPVLLPRLVLLFAGDGDEFRIQAREFVSDCSITSLSNLAQNEEKQEKTGQCGGKKERKKGNSLLSSSPGFSLGK